MNVVREGAAYQKNTWTATYRPGFILKVPGEKHAWSFTGCLDHPELLQARDSLRRLVAQNAPEALVDDVDEGEPENDETMLDVDEDDAANGPKSQDPTANHHHTTHHHSPGRPATQPPPYITYGAPSGATLIQTQRHHTPKMMPVDGSALTARDKRQKSTTARRALRRMAKK